MDDIERCAQLMGMKPNREVQEVVETADGHAVRTHDGQWTLVRDDGTTEPCEAPELVVERDHGTAEPEPEPEPEKPATKRRARS